MDILQPFIQLLEPDEHEAFRAYVSKGGDSRREAFVIIYDELRSGKKTPAEISLRAYKREDMVQLAKARSRLRDFLEAFLPGYLLTSGDVVADKPRRYLALMEVMIARQCPELGRYYLERAESAAVEQRRYDVLQQVYRLACVHHRMLQIDPGPINERWKANARKYAVLSEVLMLLAETEYAVDQSRLSGVPMDTEEVIRRIEQIDLDREEANDPAILYAIAKLVRAAILPSKYYRKLLRIAERFHHRLEKANQFRECDRDYKIGFLYMLAHVYFRIRRFDRAEAMLNELEGMFKPAEFTRHAYYTRVYSLRAQVYSYDRRAPIAVSMLEKVLAQPERFPEAGERLNMTLNLSVALFHLGQFSRSMEVLKAITGTRQKLIRQRGTEWVYKKEMIEVIVLYELGNYETARDNLARMRTDYEPFLQQPYYQRALRFMDVVLMMMDNPGIERTPEFRDRVKAAGLAFGDKEDLQAITFFCWLLSKMLGEPYYEVLMRRLAEIDPEQETEAGMVENQVAE